MKFFEPIIISLANAIDLSILFAQNTNFVHPSCANLVVALGNRWVCKQFFENILPVATINNNLLDIIQSCAIPRFDIREIQSFFGIIIVDFS